MLEKPLESPLDCKEIQPVHPKGDQSWEFIGGTNVEAVTPILLATWCEELTHLKRPWFWERLRAGGEGDDRGWDGWMASRTQRTWVLVDSGSWWWTGRPGVLQFMGLQRVGHNWVTELNICICPLTQQSHFQKFILRSYWQKYEKTCTRLLMTALFEITEGQTQFSHLSVETSWIHTVHSHGGVRCTTTSWGDHHDTCVVTARWREL